MSALVPLGILGLGVSLGLFLGKRARVLTIPALMFFGFGMHELGLLGNEAVLSGAGHVGLVLMLFFTSLFSNPRAIRDGGGVGLPLAAFDLILNFAVAWWIGDQFGWATQDRLFLAGVLATSSTAVVMKVLGDEGRITRREGNVLISLLMIEDWVFLGFYGFLGLRYSETAGVSSGAWAIAIPLFVGFLMVVRASREWIWAIQQREVLIGLLTAIGLVGAFLGGQAGLPEVGSAFTTGILLSGAQGARFAQREAPFLREATSGLFFVAYGAQLGPGLTPSLLPLLGYALGGVLLTELLFLPLLARRLGLRRSESFLLGSCLVARGGKSAAFARLYPVRADSPPLFPLAGLLAMVLTPLAPLLVKLALLFTKTPQWVRYGTPGESFSRGARGVLIPHAYGQRWSVTFWERIVFAQWVALGVLLATLGVLAPYEWRVGAVILAAACLPMMYRSLQAIVSHAPGAPRMVHPGRSRPGLNAAFRHLPLMLSAPLGLLILFAILSPWAGVAYPVVFTALLLFAILLPWTRSGPRRAPASKFVSGRRPWIGTRRTAVVAVSSMVVKG